MSLGSSAIIISTTLNSLHLKLIDILNHLPLLMGVSLVIGVFIVVVLKYLK